MISELFYPKELKEMIRKLEDEDNLRREPLEALGREINIILSLGCLIIVMTISNSDFISLLVISFLFWITILYLIKNRVSKFSVFIQGEHKKIKILKIGYRYFRNTVIKYEFVDENKIGKIRLDFNLMKTDKFYEGCNIFAYVKMSGRRLDVMPDIREIKKSYCLRTDLMKENYDA